MLLNQNIYKIYPNLKNNTNLNIFAKFYKNFTINKNRFFHKQTYIRRISLSSVHQKFDLDYLENICLEDNEKTLYYSMLDLITNHSFSPHRPYIGADYYVEIPENEQYLNNYLNNIINRNKLIPHFYVGDRGTGKTLLQNIWLMKNFQKLEDNNVFHVRCDVHKIYDLMHNYNKNNNFLLTIEKYLDMQLFYIFLKYRNKKYNNKGINNIGVESKLMKKIDSVKNFL